jgi:hypothetical protein
MPENLMSRNTLKNIEKNKERMDYCVTTFSFVSNRYPILLSAFCVAVRARQQ